MKKQNTILITIVLLTLLTFVAFVTYAFFNVGNLNTTNVANLNVISERNNMVFDVVGGAMSLNVTASNMSQAGAGNVASENNTTLTVSFQANTQESMVCSYDIIFEWTSSDKYQTHTSGVTDNEFIIGATLTSNSHVNEGNNIIGNGTDLSVAVGNQTSATVVEGAEIDSTGTSTSTATWNLSSKFYNVNANQNALSDKTYEGRFKVANVSCAPGTKSQTLVDFLVNDAPRSGTDTVSNSPWILTSDHTNEWRYAGKNPDNYIQFNGELWRIIGVMPNMTYCTGTYGNINECETTTTGSLVKIIRNGSIGSFSWDYKRSGVGSSTTTNGSNDWSDSQLMLMLNGTNYLKTGYDENNTKLHNSYSITNNIVADGGGYNFYNSTYSYLDGNGTTIYKPSKATTSNDYTSTSDTVPRKIENSSLLKISTVKWYLYGTSSYTTAAEGTPSAFYNTERNINNTGAVYTNASLVENRAVYWYGKIGLMYASDYGYATNGGNTYDRNTCLGYRMNAWDSGNYKTDCTGGSYLWYNDITSTVPETNGYNLWTLSIAAGDDYPHYVSSTGMVSIYFATSRFEIHPSLYLKADTLYGGSGTGTWDDPYTIK